jgi:hypothetical protein
MPYWYLNLNCGDQVSSPFPQFSSDRYCAAMYLPRPASTLIGRHLSVEVVVGGGSQKGIANVSPWVNDNLSFVHSQLLRLGTFRGRTN